MNSQMSDSRPTSPLAQAVENSGMPIMQVLMLGALIMKAVGVARQNPSADGTFGATLATPSTLAPETTGYYASLAGGVKMISPDNGGEPTQLVDAAKLVAGIQEGEYIGIWIDTDETIYIDRTRWFTTEDEALAFAAENNQKAIYDIANKTSINLSQLASTAN